MAHQPVSGTQARKAPEPATTAPSPKEQQAAPGWDVSLAAVQGAMIQPAQARPAEILALQRMAGNRAVSHLLSGGAGPAPLLAIQARLTVGPAHDHYEQEADRVAEQVVTGGLPNSQHLLQRQEDEEEIQTKPVAATITPLVQRGAPQDRVDAPAQPRADGSFDAGARLEHSLAANRGAGSPLPDSVRAYMEPRFGADFGGVHVHTGPQAAMLNRQVQARAFTFGRDIYMGAGSFAPGTSAGNRLLAHELTHVVQQTGAGARRPPTGPQREMIQREIPTVPEWKESSAVRGKRRSSELKEIDAAILTWHALRNTGAASKLAAINKLWYAILNWQATKKEGGRKSQRDLAILVLKDQVRQERDRLQPRDDVATLTLNVDVESDDPHNRTLWELKGAKVGHAWMTLQYDAPDPTGTRTFGMAGFNSINLAALDAGRPQAAAFGFYPINFRSEPEELKRSYGAGVNTATLGKSALVQPDTRHEAKAQQHYRVSDAAVHRVADFVQQSKGHDYSLTGYNCVSFAKGVIEAAGHVPPPTKRMFMDQANKAYRSVVRLGRAGDNTVDDRVEMVRHLVADSTKNYTNLTPVEAKAIALVMRDHQKVCREAGLYDAQSDVLPTVRRDWQTLAPAQRTRVLDPATRMAAFGPKLATHSRLYALQMAAVLMSEEQFDTWLQADKLPVQGQLVEALRQDAARSYQNLSLTEAWAIAEVTFTPSLRHVIDDMGIWTDQDLIQETYRLVYAHRDDAYQLEDPTTRIATMRAWIGTDGGYEGSTLGRMNNMQIMSLAMVDAYFDQWWSKHAAPRLRDNVPPT